MPMKTRVWLRLLQLPWLDVTKCTFYSTWILFCLEKLDGWYADFFSSNSCNDTLTCKDVSSSVSNINWLTLILLSDIGLLQQFFFEIYVKNWRCWDLYKSAYFVGKSCKWLASTSKQEKSLCPSWSFFPIIRAVQGQRVAASSLDCRHSQGKFELHSDFEGLGHFAIIWNAKTSKSTWCPIWELYFGKDKSLQTQKPQWVWILS